MANIKRLKTLKDIELYLVKKKLLNILEPEILEVEGYKISVSKSTCGKELKIRLDSAIVKDNLLVIPDFIEDFSHKFSKCLENTHSIRVIGGKNIDNMSSCFINLLNLRFVDLSGITSRKISYFNNTFYQCIKLKAVNFGKMVFSTDITFYNMFSGCESLKYVDFSECVFTESATHQNTWDMLRYCYNTSYVNIGSMSLGAEKLTSRILPNVHNQYVEGDVCTAISPGTRVLAASNKKLSNNFFRQYCGRKKHKTCDVSNIEILALNYDISIFDEVPNCEKYLSKRYPSLKITYLSNLVYNGEIVGTRIGYCRNFKDTTRVLKGLTLSTEVRLVGDTLVSKIEEKGLVIGELKDSTFEIIESIWNGRFS